MGETFFPNDAAKGGYLLRGEVATPSRSTSDFGRSHSSEVVVRVSGGQAASVSVKVDTKLLSEQRRISRVNESIRRAGR